jgi:hypothetical protein
VFNSHPEFFDVKGLCHVVERARSSGGERRARGIEGRQHDDLTFRMKAPHLLEYRQAIRARHNDVQQHNVGFFIPDFLDRLVGGHGFEDPKVFVKNHLQGLSDPRLIVDN